MKHAIKAKAIGRIAGIIALVAIIGFSMAACDDDNGDSGGGVLTITDIPSRYDNYYATSYGYSPTYDIGGGGKDGEHGARILNQRVSLNLWYASSSERYKGNDTLNFRVNINSREDGQGSDVYRQFSSVQFTAGNATVSWTAGK